MQDNPIGAPSNYQVALEMRWLQSMSIVMKHDKYTTLNEKIILLFHISYFIHSHHTFAVAWRSAKMRQRIIIIIIMSEWKQ